MLMIIAWRSTKMLILLTAFAATQSYASKWVEFGSNSPEDPSTVREVDVESLEPKFEFLRVWVRTSSETPITVPGTLKQAKSTIYLAWFDCAQSKFAISEHYYFSEAKSSGQVVLLTDLRFGREVISGAMSPISPNSTMSKLKEFLCPSASLP